jgi:hypothetical protein
MIKIIQSKFELRNNIVFSIYKDRPLLGGLDSLGYPTTSIDGVPYRIHRIVFGLVHGYLPAYVDHIDRDKTNNHPNNLREVTNTENCRNTSLRKHSTTGVKGVGVNRSGSFYAYVNTINGRRRKKATFDLEQAKKDRTELEHEYYRDGKGGSTI